MSASLDVSDFYRTTVSHTDVSSLHSDANPSVTRGRPVHIADLRVSLVARDDPLRLNLDRPTVRAIAEADLAAVTGFHVSRSYGGFPRRRVERTRARRNWRSSRNTRCNVRG